MKVRVHLEYEIVSGDWDCPVCNTYCGIDPICECCGFILTDNFPQVIGDTFEIETDEGEVKTLKDAFFQGDLEDEEKA